MLDFKKIVLGTFGYAAVTFPLAYVWHLVAFKTTYEKLGYISREEPIIVFGFFAILLQGALLALIYPFLCRGMSIIKGAVTMALVMGIYHWTMHVLAAAAKQQLEPLSLWFGVETAYLAIQFTLAGLLLALIYRKPQQENIKSDPALS
ncbi:hypothetical protein Pan153_43080 [Gimesia panareensis]|uniref:Uncharacterized protein n=1 Tax=Gimesia panareensis TaxID=2527978 RepID=A0A518FTH0_9PLAN|nr:DUF1761 domain-containing protein [Gimesia panareensis]QDV19642.1 hypothetical protein Pan153_43080 [Gimesia panareensis]